jgi:choline dehydrogenase-like flavoprotein
MRSVLVVGAGAGGAVTARELSSRFQVTVVEAGGEPRSFRRGLGALERVRPTGALADERMISLLFRPMRVRRSRGGLLLINGRALGGTTFLSAGNAVRADEGLQAVGLDLGREYDALEREIPVAPFPMSRWTKATRRLFVAFEEEGLEPFAAPKLVAQTRCRRCGKCILGCAQGAKWDSRTFLDEALVRGAKVVRGWRVVRLVIRDGRVTGVVVRKGGRREVWGTDAVVLSAGGLWTPQILENSGIPTDDGLFVDPVLCVAAEVPGAGQDRELPMPFISRRGPFMLAPYFDWLSFYFDRGWRIRSTDILSLMIKLADQPGGRVDAKGRVEKRLTPVDRMVLEQAMGTCRDIFSRMGVPRERLFLGTLNAGHPGGTLALNRESVPSMHDGRLPNNCWVADASLIPGPFGQPPILTVLALARRVAAVVSGS